MAPKINTNTLLIVGGVGLGVLLLTRQGGDGQESPLQQATQGVSAVGGAFSGLGDSLANIFAGVGAGVSGIGSGIGSATYGTGSGVGNALTGAGNFGEGIGTGAGNLFSGLGEGGQSLFQGGGSFVDSITQFFNTGFNAFDEFRDDAGATITGIPNFLVDLGTTPTRAISGNINNLRSSFAGFKDKSESTASRSNLSTVLDLNPLTSVPKNIVSFATGSGNKNAGSISRGGSSSSSSVQSSLPDGGMSMVSTGEKVKDAVRSSADFSSGGGGGIVNGIRNVFRAFGR